MVLICSRMFIVCSGKAGLKTAAALSMPLVSVITVNYNQPSVTEALLRSLAEVNSYRDVEIIVVDNGSEPDPVPGWTGRYPHVRFVRSDRNTGFAGGNNIGIREAKGDYLFLINNDTEVTPSLIDLLVGTLEQHPSVGMVSPKIHYYDHPGMLQYAGYTPVNLYTGRNHCIGQFEEDRGQYDHLSGPTAYAHGAAMMVRRSAVERAGLMDEHYFLYYEELDWCARVRKAGFEIYVNMQALILHKESVSVGKKSALKEYFMNRNRILFLRKHAPWFAFAVFCLYFMLVVAPRNIVSYVRAGQWHFIPVLLRAMAWHLTHRADSEDLGFSLNS
jgi:GT2 family glycosyltransferase